MSHPLILYGGTFDPVHFGHLRTALEIAELFGPKAELLMMPCGDPRHRRAPEAKGADRLAMLRLALGNTTVSHAGSLSITADDFEIRRTGPSYTVDTLGELRQRIGLRPMIMVMGGDAFLQFNKWQRWLEIIGLSHIMVVTRPSWSIAEQHALTDFYHKYLTRNLSDLTQYPAGKLASCQLTQLDISGTNIRRILTEGRSARFLLPDLVLDYITQHCLYGVKASVDTKCP